MGRNIFLLKWVNSFGDYVRFLLDAFGLIFRHLPRWALLREQLYSIGLMSFNVVAITGVSTGVILAAQSFYQLSEKGLASVTGIMVAKAMITELGPVLTALMVTGRIGSAMTAELGTMKVTEQVDALRSMAVDPMVYLITPRLLAGIVMVPILTIFAVILGIWGGYFISAFLFGMPHATYFEPMPKHITLFDLNSGLLKSFLFGILLISICCYKGIRTSGGAAGVGRSTTSSVVISNVSILVSDFIMTIALNNFHQMFLVRNG
jgi:phospholipid/cholesterol/gamma-HCH transport system permease protein